MAENNVIGLAMQLDVSDIKSGVKEVNKIIKSSKDEFNNATAGMDMWSKSSEGLNAKLSQLGKQLSAQEKLAAGYEAEIARVSAQEGDHTEQLNKLNQQLAKAQAEVKKTKGQMNHYSESLAEVQQEEKNANSALGKLTKTINDQKKAQQQLSKEYQSAVLQYGKNSREAKELAKKLNDLNGELEENEEKARKAEKAEEDLNKTFEDLGSKALEKSVKGLAKVGAAIGGLVASFLATAEATREFRTNMGKVNVAFDEAGFSAKQAEDTYTKFYGVLGDEGQATEAVSHLAKLATSQEDLSKWTDICTGVYATFGDSLPIEGLTEAANETAKTGELTGGLVDALNWAGISEDKFQKSLDRCNSESERQDLIQKTLVKTYGEAGKKYNETNKDIIASQEAQAKLSQSMAEVGARAEPIMTAFKEMGAKIIESLLPALDVIVPFVQDHLPALAIVSGTVSAAIGTLAAAIGILKIKTELATIATVSKTIAEKASVGATKALTAAQWLLNAAMDANPVGLVIIGIAALAGVFVLLWKKMDSFREFWIETWEVIKIIASIFAEGMIELFSNAWKGIKSAWSGVTSFFSSIWKGIKKVFSGVVKFYGDIFGKAWSAVKKAFSKTLSFFKDVYKKTTDALKNIPKSIGDLFSKAWDKVKNAFSKVSDFFKSAAKKAITAFTNIPKSIGDIFIKAWQKVEDAWSKVTAFFNKIVDTITGTFKNLPSKMKDIGKNIVKGLWNGIKDMTSWIVGKVKGFSESVLGGIKDFFGIHSPSRVMAEMGGYLVEGLAQGIDGNQIKAIKAVKNLNSKLAESFKKITDAIEDEERIKRYIELDFRFLTNTKSNAASEAIQEGIDETIQSISVDKLETYRNEWRKTLGSIEANLEKSGKSVDYFNQRFKEWLNFNILSDQLIDIEDALDMNSRSLAENGLVVSDWSGSVDSAAERAEILARRYDNLSSAVYKYEYALEMLQKGDVTVTSSFGEDITEFKIEQFKSNLEAAKKELEATTKEIETLGNVISNNPAFQEDYTGWKGFIDGLENALGISNEKLKEWSEGAGKYISKLGGYFGSLKSNVFDLVDVITDYFNQSWEQKQTEIENKLSKLEEETEAELELRQNAADEQLNILNKMYDNMELSDQEYYDKKKAIEQELSDFTNAKNAEKEASEKKLQAEKDKLARKQFESQQKTSIAQTLVNGAEAIVKGFAQLGPIGGAINAGIQAAITAAQVATIAKQKFVPMLAKGGVADGATLAMIGEAGKEAVIPLEKNTGWMETLAEKLSEIMQKDMLSGVQPYAPAYAIGGGATVVNNYYNQTINSPKALNRRELYRDSKNLLSLKG